MHVGGVALALLIVVSRHVGAEIDVLGQPVEFPIFQELGVLLLALQPLERLERLEIGRIVVLEAAAIVACVFKLIVRVDVSLLVR